MYSNWSESTLQRTLTNKKAKIIIAAANDQWLVSSKNTLTLFVLLFVFLPGINFSKAHYQTSKDRSELSHSVEHVHYGFDNNCKCSALAQDNFELSPCEIEEDDDHIQNKKGLADPSLCYILLFYSFDFSQESTNEPNQADSFFSRVFSGTDRLLNIQLLRI